jgi:uncharacterized protein (UPF0332 family)
MNHQLQQLIDDGLIKQLSRGSAQQASARLKAARRDLLTSDGIAEQSPDWAYSIAYNAALQAGRALMFHHGFRPTTGEGAHVAVIRFLEAALANRIPDHIRLLETMRRKRHQAVYETIGLIGKTELAAARAAALGVCESVESIVANNITLDFG